MYRLLLAFQIVLVLIVFLLGLLVFDLRSRVFSISERRVPERIVREVVDYSKEISELRKYVDSEITGVTGKIEEKECNCVGTTQVVTTTDAVKQTSYIAMGDAFATSSMDWVDVPGSGVYVDLADDYGEDAMVIWSASLKVAHGNGQAYARIYDATNNITVAGSEITTTNNADYVQATSGGMALWRGRNLYKVQIRSLNGFEVSYSGGKIKISY